MPGGGHLVWLWHYCWSVYGGQGPDATAYIPETFYSFITYLSLRQILHVCECAWVEGGACQGLGWKKSWISLKDIAFMLFCKTYALRNKKLALCNLTTGEKGYWREQTLGRENENRWKGVFFFKGKGSRGEKWHYIKQKVFVDFLPWAWCWGTEMESEPLSAMGVSWDSWERGCAQKVPVTLRRPVPPAAKMQVNVTIV